MSPPHCSTRNSLRPRCHRGYAFAFLLLAATLLSGMARAEIVTRDQAEARLAVLNPAIAREPGRAALFTERGDMHYLLNDMPGAIADYSAAINLDKTQDNAWFGRGMALGRIGRLDEGIADLGVYIERNPKSSVAWTKRGVRNIWRNTLAEAKRDLLRAVELDPKNAEAHDDLGVVYAKAQQLKDAARHFSTAIELDRTYQKAYHNLAIIYHLSGQHESALTIVDAGLELAADNRSSMVLKSSILKALGRTKEAGEVSEHAEFLPQDNWTERTAVGGTTIQGEAK